MFKTSIQNEEIENLSFGNFPGKIHIIDSDGLAMKAAIVYLRSHKMLGFDTETRPVFNPGQHSNGVALLQLSGPHHAYLFRVQKCGLPKGLLAVLSDPSILKIGAATLDDVRGLQKLARFRAGGFVDLQQIVSEWGIADRSVKKMSAIILGLRISKTQQLSNWEAKQLSPAQQKYAATDAWVCLEMYRKLLKSPKNPLPKPENDKNNTKERP